MCILQLKIREEGRSLAWRPRQSGPWQVVQGIIEHGDLTVYLSNGGGVVAVKVFKGKGNRPFCREIIRKNGTYILGAKKIKKL